MTTTNFPKRQMHKYVGDFSQLFGIKEYTLSGGKAKGVKAFDVRNGSQVWCQKYDAHVRMHQGISATVN